MPTPKKSAKTPGKGAKDDASAEEEAKKIEAAFKALMTDDSLSPYAKRIWAARGKAVLDEPGEEVTPVAEVVGSCYTELAALIAATGKTMNNDKTAKRTQLGCLYLAAGGVEDAVNEEAVKLMQTSAWWGAAEKCFDCRKEDVLPEIKEIVRLALGPDGSKNASSTPWISMVRKFRTLMKTQKEIHRDKQEVEHNRVKNQVDKMEGRLAVVEKKDSKAQKAVAGRLEIREPPLYASWDVSVYKGKESVTAILDIKDNQYQVLLAGKAGRKLLPKDDKRLDWEQKEAHRLLHVKYPQLDYTNLANDVYLTRLPRGHPDRRVCRWIAERRICQDDTTHSSEYNLCFNTDGQYTCLAAYRSDSEGGGFQPACTLLYKLVKHGGYIEFLAATRGSGLGSVVTNFLLSTAKKEKWHITVLHSLSSAEIDGKRVASPEQQDNADKRRETFEFWSEKMKFNILTMDNANIVLKRLVKAGLTLEKTKVKDLGEFFQLLDIPEPSEGCATLFMLYDDLPEA